MNTLKQRATALQGKVEALTSDAQAIAEAASELIAQDDIKRSAAALTALSLVKEAGKLIADAGQALGFLTFEDQPADDSVLGQLAASARQIVTEMAEELGIREEVVPIFGLDTAEIVVPVIETLVAAARQKLAEAQPQ